MPYSKQIGIGDGPWDKMKEFDDNVPHREFDYFGQNSNEDLLRKLSGVGNEEADDDMCVSCRCVNSRCVIKHLEVETVMLILKTLADLTFLIYKYMFESRLKKLMKDWKILSRGRSLIRMHMQREIEALSFESGQTQGG
nr:copine (calcium-dependent phospholipid-binding protein) family [Tanacetum cinerariifolium]